uniref:F-box domain-containing protein n=1 Tax=Mycena chlorophos TaxID=658473 RepID=A0ABQ0LGN7_MYCCL|nr:predicted protein [Mycena chlorophos]
MLTLTPQIEHILASNAPPPDSEAPSLRLFDAAVKERIAHLEEEIASAAARLEQLRADQKSLLLQQEKIRGALSPLRRLPPELLSEIFTRVMPLPCSRRAVVSTNDRDNPWALMHVSVHWRSVVSSTPSLWTRLETTFARNRPYPLRLMQAHAEHARELEIDFAGSQSCDLAPQVEAFQALTQFSAKWVSLDIDLIPGLYSQFNDLRGRLPSLRATWVDWDQQPDEVSALVFMEDAPALVDVGAKNPLRYSRICLPSNLTRYNLATTWTIHQGILKENPGLVAARIVIPSTQLENGRRNLGPGRGIHLPCLRQLYISFGIFLDELHTPNLVDITCEADGAEAIGMIAHLESLIAFSSCSLQYICLAGDPIVSAVTNLLKKIPSMTAMRLMWTYAAADGPVLGLELDKILAELACSPLLAPNLTVLSLGWDDDVSVYLDDHPETYAALSHMCKTRRNAPNSRLRSVELLRTDGVWTPPDGTAFGDLEMVMLTDSRGQTFIDSYQHMGLP